MPCIRITSLACVLLVVGSVLSACSDDSVPTDAGEDASQVTPAYIGGPCAAVADCPPNDVFDPGFTTCTLGADGYCTILGCLNPGFACPGTSRCVPTGGGWPGHCVNPCVEQTDCRAGFECYLSVTGFHFCRALREDGGAAADAGVDGG